MQNCQATWEDEENNRHVELVVNYRLDESRVEINNVTPTRVTFFCPTSGNKLRSIGVWTDGGRRMLAQQAHEAGRIDAVKNDIAEGRVVEIKHPTPNYTGKLAPVLQA
ncbi:MAG: hypothetical protein IT425_03490 [Pirellulales bacterium]|nr:hypothetical protein [Pirellulales bacterium]